MATPKHTSAYVRYSIIPFVLIIGSQMIGIAYGSSYKWGTVQVEANNADLDAGLYNIYLNLDSQTSINAYSPEITEAQLPNLNGIYIYNAANKLLTKYDSSKILIRGESFSYLKNHHVTDLTLSVLPFGYANLTFYSFYDSTLQQNVGYYSLGSLGLPTNPIRYSYYLRTIQELVYQNTLSRSLNIGDDMKSITNAIDTLRLADSLSDKGKYIYKLLKSMAPIIDQILICTNTAVKSGDTGYDAIKNLLSDLNDIKLQDIKDGFKEIGDNLKDTKQFKRLNDVSDALGVIDAGLLGTQIGVDIVTALVNFSFQYTTFIERINALEKFFDEYNGDVANIDPNLLYAFYAFKNNVFGLNNYMFTNVCTLDNLKNLTSIATDIATRGTPYGLAAWGLVDSIFELIEDVDGTHYITSGYTVLKLMQFYLILKMGNYDGNMIINYGEIDDLLQLVQMFGAQSYAINKTTQEITCFNLTSPSDWIVNFLNWFTSGNLDEVCASSVALQSANLILLNGINKHESWADISAYDVSTLKNGNFAFVESKIRELDQMTFQVSLNPSYTVGETAQLQVVLKNPLGTPIDSALVSYAVKDAQQSTRLWGDLSADGNGEYETSFLVTNMPGTYSVEISAFKQGFEVGVKSANFIVQLSPGQGHDVGIYDVSWNSTSKFNPNNSDLTINRGDLISINSVVIENYGYYSEATVPIIMQIIDPNGNVIKATSNTLYGSVDAGKVNGVAGNLYINTGSIADLQDGIYKMVVKTTLATDSNVANDSLSWDLIVGVPPKPPEQIPFGSYYYYDLIQTSSNTNLVTTISGYTIKLTYIDSNTGSLNITGSCNESWTVARSRFYSVCGGNVFVTAQALDNLGAQKFLEIEIGIKSNDTNIRQENPYQVAYRWNGQCGLTHVSDLSTVAKFDIYSQAGGNSAYLIGYRPFLGNSIGSYINTWSFIGLTSCGGTYANYEGSKFVSKSFSSSGRYPANYAIVPSANMPSGDYNFVIIHVLSNVTDQNKNPSNPLVLGYAHSVRLNVVDRHSIAVGAIQLPDPMRSGSTYSITVPVINNGDVNETSVGVSLNISDGLGYNLPVSQTISINKGTTYNVPFTWDTLGLPGGLYYINATVGVSGDNNTTDNESSTQKTLLPPLGLNIIANVDKLTYKECEKSTLSVNVKDDQQNTVSGVSVSYKVKGASGAVYSDTAQDIGGGNYSAQFNAPCNVGNYGVDISGTKMAYQNGSNNNLSLLVVDTTAPTVPVLYLPANSAILSSPPITFKWSDSVDYGSGIYRYRIQIGRNMDFGSVEIDTQTGSSNLPLTLPLGTHFWRVLAIDNSGNSSAWSEIGKFSVTQMLNPAKLSFPSNGATGQPTSVSAQWQDVNSNPQEEGYRVRIKPFGGGYRYYTATQNATSYGVSGLTQGLTYYWNIQAVGDGNSTSDSGWANSGTDWSFTTSAISEKVSYVINPNASYSYVWGNNSIPSISWQGNLNDGYFDLPLGDFDFQFYGMPTTNIKVSTNGYITFGMDGVYWGNVAIPNVNPPNAIIAPFWDDLSLAHGSVWWGLFGTAPNRQLVIEWRDVPSLGYGTEAYSFEVILYETTDRIKFQYEDVDSGTSHDLGASATVGIENFDGTSGLQYSFNGSTPLSNGLAIEFIPVTSSSIGVLRNGKWYLDMNGNRVWEGPVTDASFSFGQAGDMPVVGNWNGVPGSVGVFRGGKWYLDWNENDRWDGSATDKLYAFGLPGDIPVAGDWDGDGLTEIGVFRNGYWYLDFNGNGIWEGPSVDRKYTFGMAGDIPVVGDWNEDGSPEIGVFRNGSWYLDFNGNGIWEGPVVDRRYTFGMSGDIPVVGDWNGDGVDKIGVFRNGVWYLDYNGNGVWEGPSVDGKYSFGLAGDRPIAGKW